MVTAEQVNSHDDSELYTFLKTFSFPVGSVIPGGATLVFEMELVAIDKPPKSNEIFHDIDKDGDGRLSEDEVRMFMTLFVDSTLYSSFHVGRNGD